MTTDREMLAVAVEEARLGLSEGGVPVGGALFGADGVLLGRGHNRRVQDGDPSMHAETAAFKAAGGTDRGDFAEVTVPAGNYMMIGDNRDNSEDSRYWKFVPEANLVGSSRRIWFNVDFARSPLITWGRIGKRIE
jgi:hypothetical protein